MRNISWYLRDTRRGANRKPKIEPNEFAPNPAHPKNFGVLATKAIKNDPK